jgi:hypothetical protein
MTHLTCTVEDDLATIVLHNAPQNRIGLQMVAELDDALRVVETSGARAVLLRAEGRDFSYGGDIAPWPQWSQDELRSHFQQFMAVFNRYERLPVPTVAAVQGLCFGGGFELVLRSDVVLAGKALPSATPSSPSRSSRSSAGSTGSPSGRDGPRRWSGPSPPNACRRRRWLGSASSTAWCQTPTCSTRPPRSRARRPRAPRAHAAHKALLRTWAVGGTAAADEIMFDVAVPLWSTEDTRMAIPAAVEAIQAGQRRPDMRFQGR